MHKIIPKGHRGIRNRSDKGLSFPYLPHHGALDDELVASASASATATILDIHCMYSSPPPDFIILHLVENFDILCHSNVPLSLITL